VRQRTAEFHDPIADARLPEAAGVVDHAAARDATVDGLEAHAAARDPAIRRVLRACEGPAPRLLGRPAEVHVGAREGQEAQILEPAAPRGPRGRGRRGTPLLVGAAGLGVAQQPDRERGVDPQHGFDRVACCLAAITARLRSRIVGTPEAPLGAIMATRGEAGGSAGIGDPSGGTPRVAASASATPRRWAHAAKDRFGASPRVRRVACRTAHKTCIH
jgi:hypothetical protein